MREDLSVAELGRPLQPAATVGVPTLPQSHNRYSAASEQATIYASTGTTTASFSALIVDNVKAGGIGTGVEYATNNFGFLDTTSRSSYKRLKRAGIRSGYSQSSRSLVQNIDGSRFRGSAGKIADFSNIANHRVTFTSISKIVGPAGQLAINGALEVAFLVPEINEIVNSGPFYSPIAKSVKGGLAIGSSAVAYGFTNLLPASLSGGPTLIIGAGISIGIYYTVDYGVIPAIEYVRTTVFHISNPLFGQNRKLMPYRNN